MGTREAKAAALDLKSPAPGGAGDVPVNGPGAPDAEDDDEEGGGGLMASPGYYEAFDV